MFLDSAVGDPLAEVADEETPTENGRKLLHQNLLTIKLN